jgi:hypothetical protein
MREPLKLLRLALYPLGISAILCSTPIQADAATPNRRALAAVTVVPNGIAKGLGCARQSETGVVRLVVRAGKVQSRGRVVYKSELIRSGSNSQRVIEALRSASRVCKRALARRVLPSPTVTPPAFIIVPSPTPTPAPTLTPTPVNTPTRTAAPTATRDIPTTSAVTQNGITFEFEGAVPFGRFINGDYWVVAPVRLVRITPDSSGGRHGFEINPSSHVWQGFDSRAYQYDGTRVPSLPRTLAAGDSVLKSISLNPGATTCRPCLERAAVLTVVSAPPPVDSFRPGYFGASRRFYNANEIDLSRLPLLSPVNSAPSTSALASQISLVQIDHQSDWVGRSIHPSLHGPDYGASIATRNNEAVLKLLVDGSSDRLQLARAIVQYGIDLMAMIEGGANFKANGGHTLGRLLPLATAAVLLDDPAMKGIVENSTPLQFDENLATFFSPNANQVLFGHSISGAGERGYWDNIVNDRDSRTQRDPYGFIDGGYRPGASYQHCCISQPYKGTALAVTLIPRLAEIWPNPYLLSYADRWVSSGAVALPDPCAPAEGSCTGGINAGQRCTSANELTACPGGLCTLSLASYGITFGPDGAGSCIRDTDPSDGIGRFPTRNGSSVNGGSYGSSFVNQMWDAHYP